MPDHAPTRRNRRRWQVRPGEEPCDRDPEDFDFDFDPDPEAAETWQPAKRASRLPSWIPAPLRTTLRITIKTGAIVTLLVLAVALFYLCLSFRYDLQTVTNMPERSVILDHKNREIATLHGENRRIIPREEIPAFFVQALLAREDKRFFSHHGTDLPGLGRATLRNIRDLSFTQGASTLTMQLARNTFDMRQRSLHRKLLEIALAFRIEAHFTKDEILASYVNRIYFGSACHGLEEASRRYFDRSAADLTPTQAALLAGIIRAPHACSPLRNLEGAIKQRDEVLERMVHEAMLGSAEAETIKAYPLQLNTESRSASGSAAERAIGRHFEELLEDPALDRGGLRIRSSIDANIQLLVEAELKLLGDAIDPGLEVAAVCVDPRNGAVRAIVGGRESSPASRFNRALDTRRDLGSAFSPFLFAAAAERGYPLDLDNIVSTGRRIGAAETTRLVKRLGITGPFHEGDDLFRGAVAASPLELATAIATLSNDGQRPRTFLVQDIISPRGEFLFTNHPKLVPALSPQAVSESLKIHFSAERRPTLTGLNPGRTDAWAIFFSPRFAICIWVGSDQPKPLADPDAITAQLDSSISRLARELTPTR